MAKRKEFKLKINKYSPDTIPMRRLGEYMIDFANLLGEANNIHFAKVVKGSAVLKAWSEDVVTQKVETRLHLVKTGNSPPEAQSAYNAINKKLKEDNTDGIILENRKKVITFLGFNEPETPVFGPIMQSGSLDGVLIGLGGKNLKASVRLLTPDGEEIICKAAKEIVKKLGHYLYDTTIRLTGYGKWIRDSNGKWIIESFNVSHFDILDDRSLIEVVRDLRSIKGSQWNKIENPWEELKNIRGDA